LVGNCSDIKNHELALNALLQIREIRVAHLGSELGASDEEKTILDDLSGSSQLVYRGSGNPKDWLSRADVFLLPSRHEGMSVALLEALVSGVPALVANVPALRWVADLQGVTAVESSPNRWQRAIRKAIDGGPPVDRKRLAQRFSAARGAQEFAR